MPVAPWKAESADVRRSRAGAGRTLGELLCSVISARDATDGEPISTSTMVSELAKKPRTRGGGRLTDRRDDRLRREVDPRRRNRCAGHEQRPQRARKGVGDEEGEGRACVTDKRGWSDGREHPVG